MRLTDEQWLAVEPLLTGPERPVKGRHRASGRDVLDGILWVLRSGEAWRAIPAEFPSRRVCRRQYEAWKASGVMRSVLVALTADLEHRAGVRADDPGLELPDVRRRALWPWQTILLLRSPLAVALLREDETSSAAVAEDADP